MFGKRKGSPLANKNEKDPRTASPLKSSHSQSTPIQVSGTLTRTLSVMSFTSADSTIEPVLEQQESGNRGANQTEHVTDFTTKIDGAFRNEITVEVQKLNGTPFKGSITYKEAKYDLFQNGLQMDLTEFESVTLGFKGVPVAIFKLANPVNIDDFASIQFFDYTRKYKVGSRIKEDVISCKIRGVRIKGGEPANEDMGGYRDEGIRWVKVEGTDYRIREEMILNWLSLWGQPMSDLKEETFEEEGAVGGSGTGIYSVKMKLDREIPQLLPMDGKRVKIFYRGIEKLCTNCFRQHNRAQCKDQKVPWIAYVEDFMKANGNIPKGYYGSWSHKVELNDTEEGGVRTQNRNKGEVTIESDTLEPGMDNDQVGAGSTESLDLGVIDQLTTNVSTHLSINPEPEPSSEIQTMPEYTGTMPKKPKQTNSLPQEDEIEIEKLMGVGFDRGEAEGMQVFNRKRRERESKAASKQPPDKTALRRGRSTQEK